MGTRVLSGYVRLEEVSEARNVFAGNLSSFTGLKNQNCFVLFKKKKVLDKE